MAKSKAVGRAKPPDKGLTNTDGLPEVEVVCTPEGANPPRTYKSGARVQVDDFQLTARERRFADEYLIDLKAREAALRAGYADSSAQVQADRLLKNPYVSAYIRMRQAQTSEATGLSVTTLVKDLWDMAHADVNELVEYRVGACRYCWGIDHQYQYTQAQFDRLSKEHELKQEIEVAKGRLRLEDVRPLDPGGGFGFNPNREPNPLCPECHGDGAGRTVFKDTRKASRAARLLYMGVKETQHGLEVKVSSPLEARKLVGDHLGAWAPQKHEHEHSGRIQQDHSGSIGITPDQAYLEMMRGAAK